LDSINLVRSREDSDNQAMSVGTVEAGLVFTAAPLVYAVSVDDGATWGAPVIVHDEGLIPEVNGAATTADRDLIYPAVCFFWTKGCCWCGRRIFQAATSGKRRRQSG